MKLSIAVLALISGSQSRRLIQRENVQLGFATGMDNKDIQEEPSDYARDFE